MISNHLRSIFYFYFLAGILLLLSGCTTQSLYAQSEDPSSRQLELIEENMAEWQELYRSLHANPELSGQERETSRRLAQELNKLGLDVTEGVGGFGVVGVLENGPGPVVLLRSDMDALPIEEQTGAPYASEKRALLDDGTETPVMHACGHDMHMTTMVATVDLLVAQKEQWSGTLVAIGQPAEETLQGARAMIEDGLFERFPEPDYMLALHMDSELPAGEVGMKYGYFYANIDTGVITVHGRGGHGAYPNRANDPVLTASRLVTDLHTIVSREVAATEFVTLSVGSIQSGTAANIVPESAVLKLTLRTHGDRLRERMIQRIEEKSKAAGLSSGLPESEWPDVEWLEDGQVASVYNTPSLGESLERSFRKVLDDESLHVAQFGTMYGEDFGEYGSARPDTPAFIFKVGSVSEQQMDSVDGDLTRVPGTHSPRFLPDPEKTLQTGALVMSQSILDLLQP
ncbi:MAG: amidohydrolase [Balneolaceae bacterium]